MFWIFDQILSKLRVWSFWATTRDQAESILTREREFEKYVKASKFDSDFSSLLYLHNPPPPPSLLTTLR